MNKPITIEEAKNYDKTDYLNHMKEQSEARVNKAIEIINQIIGINYEMAAWSSRLKTSPNG